MSDTSELQRHISDLNAKILVKEEQLKSIDKRLSSIEDTLKWLVRLVIGALIMAVVAFAMKGGLVIG